MGIDVDPHKDFEGSPWLTVGGDESLEITMDVVVGTSGPLSPSCLPVIDGVRVHRL